MRTLGNFFKRLLCWLLVLLLAALAAVGGVLGLQGWRLYRTTQQDLPAAQLYETISARPSFTTCDASINGAAMLVERYFRRKRSL